MRVFRDGEWLGYAEHRVRADSSVIQEYIKSAREKNTFHEAALEFLAEEQAAQEKFSLKAAGIAFIIQDKWDSNQGIKYWYEVVLDVLKQADNV